MNDSDIAAAERKHASSIAKQVGVDEASVKKILDHLGLSTALSNRAAAGGKLNPEGLSLRIAAGQIIG